MITDTKALTDLKEELYQLCDDIDKLVADIADEAKAKEVANSLDEMIEQAGECVEMIEGSDDEMEAKLREAAGLPPEEEPESEEVDEALVEAHDKMHDGTEYADDHDHAGIESDVHDRMHEMMDAEPEG